MKDSDENIVFFLIISFFNILIDAMLKNDQETLKAYYEFGEVLFSENIDRVLKIASEYVEIKNEEMHKIE